MKQSDFDFDKRFKERFVDYKAKVNDDFWKNIEPKIPGPNNYIRSTIIVLLLLTGSSTYYFISKKDVAHDLVLQHKLPDKAEVTFPIKELPNPKSDLKSIPIDLAKSNPPKKDKITTLPTQVIPMKTLGGSIVARQNTEFELVSSQNEKITPKGLMLFPNNMDIIEAVHIRSLLEIKPKRNKNFSLYFSINPFLTYQRVIPFLDDDIVITDLENSSLNPKRLGINISLGSEFNISPKLDFYGGLSFNKFTSYIKYSYHDYIPKSVEIFNKADGETTYNLLYDEFDSTVYLKNYSIGVESGIRFKINKFGINNTLDIGLDWQYIFKSSNIDSFKSRNILYLTIKNNIEFLLNSNLVLTIGPQIHYTLYSKQLQKYFSLRPYNIGFHLGVKKSF